MRGAALAGGRACSRGGSAAAGWPRPGRRRRCRRSPRRRARCSSQTVTSRPASLGDGDGLLGQPLRVLEVGRAPWPAVRARQPAPPTASPRCEDLGRSSRRRRRARSGVPGVPRARWSASGSRTSRASAPTTNARRPASSPTAGDRGGDGVAVLVRRASAAPARRRSVGVRSPTPDQQHQPQVAVGQTAGAGTRAAWSPRPPCRSRGRARAPRAGRARAGRPARRRPGPRHAARRRPRLRPAPGRASTSAPRRAGGSSLSELGRGHLSGESRRRARPSGGQRRSPASVADPRARSHGAGVSRRRP